MPLIKQVNEYLTDDCQRGCRLFDIALNKEFSFEKLNDAVALTSCQQCMSKTYLSLTNSI